MKCYFLFYKSLSEPLISVNSGLWTVKKSNTFPTTDFLFELESEANEIIS